MKHILIIKHGALGDVFQAEGAFRDIRLAYKSAKITVLTAPPYRRIFERCPSVDKVLTDARASWWNLKALFQLKKKLQAQQFDCVIDLQNSSRTGFYYKWLFKDTDWSGIASGGRHPERSQMNGLERLATQLQQAGITTRHTKNPDLNWMVDPDSSSFLKTIESPYIVLLPGSSASAKQKRWPYYAKLATRLIQDGYHIVTVPGPDEMDLCQALPGTALTHKHGGCLNFFELATILKSAHYVVGNDTGPSHLAAHLGCRGLVLFGAHISVKKTAIVRDKFKAVEVDHLENLSCEDVYEKCLEVLSDFGYHRFC